MKLLDAAERLLVEAGGPLHVREIARRAAEEGLIGTSVLAVDTVYAGLQRAVAEAGAGAPVIETPPGTFTLRDWRGVAEEAEEADRRITVELEPEEEPFAASSAQEPRALWAHVVALVREEPALPLYARAHAYLRGLLAWGALNVLGGLALIFRPRSSLAAGLSSALLDWGASQAALALVGLDQVHSEDRDAAAGILDEPALAERRAWYRQAEYALGAAGAVAAIVGLVFGLLGKQRPRTRGRALGILTQGSFLVTLSLVDRLLHRARGEGEG